MPEPEQIELRNLKRKVKERVKAETSSIPKIYEEELARSNLSSTVLTLSSTTDEGKSGFNRVRRKTSSNICISQKQINTLTERYEQEQITLIDFLYGLSTLVAKRSAKPF
ncbi:unnamed protein product [Rotaria sp. Silwood1]|nr:unnamed protein product [Rotaria sp. Silwood1]CAF3423955.1 unnamed protein product [Rotaria sp. Silwood1]CAF3441000.1 unnamed protein product [Rotaria sp. Silwood1]CAF4768987.1 unnamed protein product [Rotaria sp. Silwood1]